MSHLLQWIRKRCRTRFLLAREFLVGRYRCRALSFGIRWFGNDVLGVKHRLCHLSVWAFECGWIECFISSFYLRRRQISPTTHEIRYRFQRNLCRRREHKCWFTDHEISADLCCLARRNCQSELLTTFNDDESAKDGELFAWCNWKSHLMIRALRSMTEMDDGITERLPADGPCMLFKVVWSDRDRRLMLSNARIEGSLLGGGDLQTPRKQRPSTSVDETALNRVCRLFNTASVLTKNALDSLSRSVAVRCRYWPKKTREVLLSPH